MSIVLTNCPETLELEAYIGEESLLIVDLLKHFSDHQTFTTLDMSLHSLVRNFIHDNINPNTNRIENREAEHCYDLLDKLKHCQRMLEKALDDNDYPE